MRRPRVAICVVTYNSAALIEDLVASLAAGISDVDATLVFADNASADDTVARIAAICPSAVLVRTGGNLGYAGGVNAAIRAAGACDAYLILNADVRLEPGCVATLFHRLSPTVGIVVPKLLDARDDVIWSMRRAPSVVRAWADALLGAERVGRVPILGEMVTDPVLYETARPTDWAEGSTQLISAACVEACGPWDESYFLFSEETEFDLRAGDRGFATLYEPAAVARHLEGGSAGSERLWPLVVLNRVRLYGSRHGRIATGLFWLATLAREVSRALMGRPESRAAVQDLLSGDRMREPRGPRWLDGVRV
jgi:N-acetylglucosaminyl-diphospho-decaprenol L-rhamnosyltransferase